LHSDIVIFKINIGMGTFVKRDATQSHILKVKYRYFSLFLVLFFLLTNFTITTNNLVAKSENNIELYINIFFEEPSFSEIKVNNTIFTTVNMKNCISKAQLGDPILPVYPARILIPFNEKIKKIEVDYADFKEISFNLLDKPIVPQQEIFPFIKEKDHKNFLINDTKYSSNEKTFDNIFSLGDIGFLRGYKILIVYLYPIHYIPSKGKIYHTSNINIKLEFEKDQEFLKDPSNRFLRNTNNDQDFIKNLVENPETIDTYLRENEIFEVAYSSNDYSNCICNPEEKYEYVIITSNSLKDTNGFDYNLSDLISHRELYNNYNGNIVTTEEIDSCSAYWNASTIFNDTQAHIREFCKDAYQNWETEYVLLAGDWDSTPSHKIVPYRLFTDNDEVEFYDSMACDMYYSHLDGDWYYNESVGMWGGGKDSANDIYGELYVGRIACYDAETISNSVYKIINYETNSSYQNSWLRSASFLGGDLGWTATSKEYMEEIRIGTDTYRTFTGFEEWNNNSYEQLNTSERIYHADIGSDYKNYFKKSVENDNFSIINHLGHANINLPFELTNWDLIYNTKPFFGYSQGCLSGRFHDGESGCEKLICKNKNKHAFALVLNTGYGYGSVFNTDGPSQYINSFFWDYLLNDQSTNQSNWYIGKAMVYAQDKMASMIDSDSHAWCYAWYSANLFGDPAQKLRISANDDIQINNENPINCSIDASLELSNLSVDIFSFNENNLNWTIETCPDIGKSSGFNDTQGTKICNISNLTYSTNYTWYVNVTDGLDIKNTYYLFRSRNKYLPNSPLNFYSIPYNKHQINLSWNKSNISDLTIIEYNIINETWNKGEGIEIYNESGASFIHTNLSSNTTYYYHAWSWNIADGISSINKSCTNSTTYKNTAPSFSSPHPVNESADQAIFINWTIRIIDVDFDLFNYSIKCSNNQSKSINISSNGIKYLELTNLSYDTQYKIWVNASDENDRNSSWYIFTTESAPIENNPPTIIDETPKNNSTDVSIDTYLLSVLINDSDDNTFNWSITTNPNVGSNYEIDATNGSKKCYITDLSYSTNYTWYVCVTDGINYRNKTFVFTTESEPQNDIIPPAGGSGYTPPVADNNSLPIADAGGPYSGYTDEIILFDGSKSFDPDGDVLTYNWEFGDNTESAGEKTTHVYDSDGKYKITLIVSDGRGGQKTDVTYAVISKKVNDTLLNEENNSGDFLNLSNNDNDKDGILDEDEIKLGSDPNNSSDAFQIVINGSIYYLVDIDKDEKLDLLFNPSNGLNTTIQNLKNEEILIDLDGDNDWDYNYNFNENSLTEYFALTTNENEPLLISDYLIILAFIIFFVSLIIFIKLRKIVNVDEKLNKYLQNLKPSKESIFYFKDYKKKKDDPKIEIKDLEKKQTKKTRNVSEIVDKIINSKNKK